MPLEEYWYKPAAGGYQLGNSLRFRGAQALARTNSTGSNITYGTYDGTIPGSCSVWVKRSRSGVLENFISGQFASNQRGGLKFSSNVGSIDHFVVAYQDGGGFTQLVQTDGLRRDPSAWMHIHVTAQPGGNWIVHINGVQVNWIIPVSPPAGGFLRVDNGGNMYVGCSSNADSFFEGYLAELHVLQTNTAATDFGEFNADGVWVPKKVTGLTYGANGFHLAFDDVTQIGKDSSGNNNHFTATGFELTSADNNDWFTPEDLQSPWNMLAPIGGPGGAGSQVRWNTVRTGNAWANAGWCGYSVYMPPTLLPTSGKYYLEVVSYNGLTYGYNSGVRLGLSLVPPDVSAAPKFDPVAGDLCLQKKQGTFPFGLGSNQATLESLQASTQATVDITGAYSGSYLRTVFYLDMDAGKGWIGVPSWDGTSVTFVPGADPTNPATGQLTFTPGTQYVLILHVMVGDFQGGIGQNQTVTFTGNSPTTHPAGYKSLVPANLPDVAITNPSDHFTTILDTGANILTNAQATFPNGLWWIKDRANNNQHQFVDSVRGGTSAWRSPDITFANYAAPAGNSVAWCWKAGDVGVANSNGSEPSTCWVNKEAGFSIIRYTGRGVDGTTGGITVGHGLDRKPDIVFYKGDDGAASTGVYTDLHGTFQYARLNGSDAFATTAYTAPTDAVLTLTPGGSSFGNTNGVTYTAYAWHSVPGYSAFGSYVGNGSADGPFIYTGFRPAFLLIKRTDTTADWAIMDGTRNPYNPTGKWLLPNRSDAEANLDATAPTDILSNGFKLRNATGTVNSGSTYIYCAFAEHPFGGGNVSPSPAR